MRRAFLLVAFLSSVGCGPCCKPSSVEDESRSDPPPTSFCELVRPWLAQAKNMGSFHVDLTCFPVPGVVGQAFYGTLSQPTLHRLQGCFEGDPSVAKLTETSSPFDATFRRRFEVEIGTDGSLDLSFLGNWAPVLRAGAGLSRKATVAVEFRDARFVHIVDLAHALCATNSERALSCIGHLKKPESTYVPVALVGRLYVGIAEEGAAGFTAEANAADLVRFESVASFERGGGSVFRSRGLVTIAGVVSHSAPDLVEVDDECRTRYEPVKMAVALSYGDGPTELSGTDSEIDTDDWTGVDVSYALSVIDGRKVGLRLTMRATELEGDRSYDHQTIIETSKEKVVFELPTASRRRIVDIVGVDKEWSAGHLYEGKFHDWRGFRTSKKGRSALSGVKVHVDGPTGNDLPEQGLSATLRFDVKVK